MKTYGSLFLVLTILIALTAFPALGGNLPHPYDNPAINFQGRIEVGDIGFSMLPGFASRSGTRI